MPTVTYNIATDFTSLVGPVPVLPRLEKEIVLDPTVGTKLDYTEFTPVGGPFTDVIVTVSTTLTGPETTALDAVIAAHIGTPLPDTSGVPGEPDGVATLDGSGELPLDQLPAHGLGSTEHTSATLVELNALVSDAMLGDSGDTRPPTAHNHTAADTNSGTFDDARIAESSVTQHQGALDHDQLTNFDATEHRVINDSGTSTTELWSASKLSAEFTAVSSGYARRTACINLVNNTAVPPTEVLGDRYILDFTAGGVNAAWDGALVGDIVEFNGTTWDATSPLEGWIAYLDAQNKDALYVNDGTPTWEIRPTIPTDHADLTGIGTNTHAQIDTHVADTTNPHATDLGSLGTGSLAELNATVTDATLDDSGDARPPTTHAIGGSAHSASTLAQLNALVSDATLDDAGDSRTDTNAIHDNVAGEINAVTEKVTPVAADLLIIEDSADVNNKKKVQVGNLPGGGGGGNVTAAANLADEAVVRGDGGAKGVQHASQWTIADDGALVGTVSRNGYAAEIFNTKGDGGGNGLHIRGGELDNDIALRVADADDSLTFLEIEGNAKGSALYATHAATLALRGQVYGWDNQASAGNNADFNTENGVYRIAGTPIDPYSIGGLTTQQATATASGSVTSAAYTLVPSMTVTPGAGTYLATYSASGRATSNNQRCRYALFNNGVIIGHTKRDYGFDIDDPNNEDQRVTLHTQAVVTMLAGQALQVRARTNIGTFWHFKRSLILLRLSN